jgi:hypothetical protein
MRRIKKLLSKKLNGGKEFEIALELVEGPVANAIHNIQSNSQGVIQRK